MPSRPIVFSDIDFTIVFDSEIHPKTVELIEQVRRQARFVLVTARSKAECEGLPDIPNDGFIAENGAAVYLREHGRDRLDPEWEQQMHKRQSVLEAFRDELASRGWCMHKKLHAFSSCIDSSGMQAADVQWVQDNLPAGLQLEFSRNTAGRYIEVFPAEAGKDKAVHRLCARLGVDLQATFGLGDNSNDLPMLETVKMPLAPGNCHPDVRALVTQRGGFVAPLEGHAGAQEMLRELLRLL